MEVVQKIGPVPGFDGEVGTWVSALDEVRAQVKSAVRGLDPAALAWTPPGGGNSIGQLLRHIALIELDWIVTDLCGGSELPPGAPALLQLPEPMADPGLRPLSEFLASLDFARDYTKSRLKDLPAARLEDERRWEGKGVKKVFNVRWILHHLVDHEAQHKGQLLAVKRMLPV